MKTKIKSKEMFKKLQSPGNSSQSSSSSSPKRNTFTPQPFQKGSLPNQGRGRGRGTSSLSDPCGQRGKSFNSSERTNDKVTTSSSELQLDSSISKGPISKFIEFSDLSSRGKTETFLTNNVIILQYVRGYQIPFTNKIPFQSVTPRDLIMNQKHTEVMEEEVRNMIEKGEVKLVQPCIDQYLSNVFIVNKKEGEFRPVINLKTLNAHVPYSHFKMEGLGVLKELLCHQDLMVKLDLFYCALGRRLTKECTLQMEKKNLSVPLHVFQSAPAPRVFTKLMKVPITLMRRINIRFIIYLDDIPLMGSTQQEEIIMIRDTKIYLLQHLGFLINLKKSALTSC